MKRPRREKTSNELEEEEKRVEKQESGREQIKGRASRTGVYCRKEWDRQRDREIKREKMGTGSKTEGQREEKRGREQDRGGERSSRDRGIDRRESKLGRRTWAREGQGKGAGHGLPEKHKDKEKDKAIQRENKGPGRQEKGKERQNQETGSRTQTEVKKPGLGSRTER